MLPHADDLGGHAGLAPVVRAAEIPDDVFGADQDDLEVGIGGKRFGHSLEHDARGIVSAHGIDADDDAAHCTTSLYANCRP